MGSVPLIDFRELAESSWVVNAVANGTVEEVCTCEARFLKWEGIFLGSEVVSEEAPESIVRDELRIYVYVE